MKEQGKPARLVDAITEMREGEALALTKQMLDDGADPLTILDDCRAAMEIVGRRFELGEYFLPELVLAGEMLKQLSALVKPHIQQTSETKKRGKVMMGTVKGDIHDLGKDIVVFMLEANGFEVYDLGVDVPAQTFVDKIREVRPDVAGLSGLLTVAADSMKQTVEAIRAAGLRDRVKIMIGGGVIDDHVRLYAGADAFGADAMAAVSLAKQWIEGK
jgi:5-methyltetrahydrofolate--homocysteine methyltransferase